MMDLDKLKDQDLDLIVDVESTDENWRDGLEHLACRNCGQEFYTIPARLAAGCWACGTPDWPGRGGLFKRISEGSLEESGG